MIVSHPELPAVHAAVDRLVLTHGAYEPIELLLEWGILDYERYEDWRRGGTVSLEEAVSAKQPELLALLGAAVAWAGKLGLTPVPLQYESWGGRHGSLTVSPEPEIERLTTVRYEPVEISGQLDLFLDAGGARDFLTPFWRRFARRVDGAPFDRTGPDLHASFAVAQCLDWRGVSRSVRATAGYADEPVLLARLCEAELRCDEHVRAIGHLMRLCWLAADAAAEHLGGGSLGDRGLLTAWQSFQDLDSEIAIDAAWFPATLLFDEPGLARVCVPVAPEPAAAPVRAYATLAALFCARGEAPNETREIRLRRELKDAHPGILALYLHRREAARRH